MQRLAWETTTLWNVGGASKAGNATGNGCCLNEVVSVTIVLQAVRRVLFDLS